MMNKSGKGTMARLMEYITARHKKEFFLVVACILISVIAAMVGNSFMQVIIDDYILKMLDTGETLFSELLRVVLAMAAVFLAGALGTLFYNRIIAIIGQKVLKEIRDDLFVKMQTFPISFFDTHTHGDIMSVYTNDTDTLRQFIAQSLPMMISSLVTIVFAFCFMLRFSLILTAIVVVMSIIMILVARAMVKYSGKYFTLQQDSTGTVNGYIEEMFGGLKVIKVFCHEEKAKEKLRELNEELYSNALRANGTAGALMPIMSGFGNLQYLVVAIIGGAMALFGDGMFSTTIGTLISFLGLIRQFTSSITQTAQQMNSAVLGFAGASRIFELMDNEPEQDEGYVTLVHAKEQDGQLVECEDGDIYAWKHPHHDGTLTYTKVQGNVVLDHVDFSYDGRKLVLHDISLYAKPGQKIAFVGATGAGKTTITNLINRFYDLADGKIRYDGINITKIRKTDLRRSMGIMIQECLLLEDRTIAENIMLPALASEESYGEARARADRAMKECGIEDLAAKYPAALSAGQKQIACLARAIVNRPVVVLADEPCAHLDIDNAQHLMDLLGNVSLTGVSVIVASHIELYPNTAACRPIMLNG